MLKKLILTAVLVVPFIASASQLPDYPFIHASGNGFMYVAPDTGEVDFEISANQADPDAARQLVEARIAEVRALVASVGLPDGDVEIRDIRKEMRKGEASQPGVAMYDIKCGVHIKVADIGKWKALVSPLISMANVDGFMTAFDTSKRGQVESELMGAAIKSARAKGEAMAAGFGRKLGPVSAVSSGELKNMTRAMGLAAAEQTHFNRSEGRSQSDRDALLMVALMKMSQSVDVIFRIK